MENENKDTDHKITEIRKVDGCKNWLILMVFIFTANLMYTNYQKFGLITNPVNTFFSLIYLIIQHWKLYCLTMIFYIQHILQVYAIEKLIIWGYVLEKTGMIMHALNVFFLPTAFTVSARLTDSFTIFSRVLAVYNMYVMTKTWSYAFVNRRLRNKVKDENETSNINKGCTIPYPSNVNLRNLINYFVLLPPIEYRPDLPANIKPNWTVLPSYAAKQFLVIYITVSYIVQFVIPELMILELEGNTFLNSTRCALNIALPQSVGFFVMAYMGTYKLFLPAYAKFAGTTDVVFSSDWWNSTDVNMFWRKWNLPVHNCLKYNVVIPLIKCGVNKNLSCIFGYVLAGILHEYLNSLPAGIYNGVSLVFTLLEVPFGYITVYIAKRFGIGVGNIAFWIYLVGCHTYAPIMVSYSIINIKSYF